MWLVTNCPVQVLLFNLIQTSFYFSKNSGIQSQFLYLGYQTQAHFPTLKVFTDHSGCFILRFLSKCFFSTKFELKSSWYSKPIFILRLSNPSFFFITKLAYSKALKKCFFEYQIPKHTFIHRKSSLFKVVFFILRLSNPSAI